MDPQQEIFTAIKLELEKKGYDVYDGMLPPDDTPYPFIYLGQARQTDDLRYKGSMLASVFQDIHVWHNSPKKRGTVSEMIGDIRRVCASLESTDSYSWQYKGMESNILTDATTKTPLLHGVATAEFHLTGGIEHEEV